MLGLTVVQKKNLCLKRDVLSLR